MRRLIPAALILLGAVAAWQALASVGWVDDLTLASPVETAESVRDDWDLLRDNALVTRTALRSVSRIFSLVGAKAGFAEHPVSRAKRDVEMVSHHVTLNWRQNAVHYMASRV